MIIRRYVFGEQDNMVHSVHEHDEVLARVMAAVLTDDAPLFMQFSDSPAFRKWLADTIFSVTNPLEDT